MLYECLLNVNGYTFSLHIHLMPKGRDYAFSLHKLGSRLPEKKAAIFDAKYVRIGFKFKNLFDYTVSNGSWTHLLSPTYSVYASTLDASSPISFYAVPLPPSCP